MYDRQHNREKKSLERAAIQHFIQIFNQNHVRKLRLLYLQEKPDVVLQEGQLRKLGMEITHLFYDMQEAQMLFGRLDKPYLEPERIERLIAELNVRIRSKEEKRHSYDSHYPVSLLIRNASPTFGMSDILKAKQQLYHPGAAFQDVWLLSRDGTKDWLLVRVEKNSDK